MLLLSIIIIILSSATILRRDFSILLSRVILYILPIMFYINYNSTHFYYLEKGISLYNGLYQSNATSHTFNLFLIIISFSIISLNSYYPRKTIIKNLVYNYGKEASNNLEKEINGLNVNNSIQETYIIDKENNQFKILEYSLLILFVLCGAIFLVSINDIISIFISIELQSYGLYLLCSVYRNSEMSTKAGLTYFLLGGLSSCIILLSQGLLYINSGNTNLENIYILSNINVLSTDRTYDIISNSTDILYTQFYINISLAILSVGFLFKVSAAPFHFWSPDVYDGVPTIVTTFIAIIAKISIFIFLLQLIHFTNNTFTESLSYNWSKNLLISSLLSLIIGTVLGLTQSRIKRLYAYSTISHVGFILLALSINTTESIQAFIFYLIQYSISNLNAFVILLSVGYFFINYSAHSVSQNKRLKGYTNLNLSSVLRESNNSPVQLISQIKGLYKINAVLALSFALTLFSFLGVPPLLGFFGKQMVLSAALDSGYIFMCLVAILTSVISAVYYLIVIKQMFFDVSDYKNIHNVTVENKAKSVEIKPDKHNLIVLSSNLTVLISILTLASLIFMFVPVESLNLVKILSLFIFDI